MSMQKLHDRIQVETCKKKRAFASEETAKIAIRNKGNLRPYKCGICGNWHLTSKDDNRKPLRMPRKKRHKGRRTMGRRKDKKGIKF